jgi:4-amino-4-deoxy-L-arabinose transferase-like glycosyltransferase
VSTTDSGLDIRRRNLADLSGLISRGDRHLARKSALASTRKQARKTDAPAEAQQVAAPQPRGLLGRLGVPLAVAALLTLHVALAESSLIQENPTVDEVAHLPAGVTYWQKGTFRLYHHNPPLVKLVAALPVVWARPVTEPLYQHSSWRSPDPSQATFSQWFAYFNAPRYFELFQLGRMLMPLFSVAGGLAVFLWSRRLYGTVAGFLSLCLWVFCPNVLAHARLITTDMGATAVGVAATYVFWRYLDRPSWKLAVASGIMLGLALLCKFSMLLLYAAWPFFWLVRLLLLSPTAEWFRRAARGFLHGLLMVVLSVLVIDAGYFFEGVGKPLGRFEFISRALTRPVEPTFERTLRPNPLYDMLLYFRENRFRGTLLEHVPVPLPDHYVLGFDEQKVETEGIPKKYDQAWVAIRHKDWENARKIWRSPGEETAGYRVYLDGEMRDTGWWYYYLLALVYKVPEGTWLLVLSGLVTLLRRTRTRAAWADEILLWTIPCVVLYTISFLTDINLGLRYVLPIAPYVFIATGKVVPAIERRTGWRRWLRRCLVAVCLGLTAAATASIHPHYLAYFNWTCGGPDREPAHLIDSNLDWGQDLIGLREWCRREIPNERIGLAYFGQISPSIFDLRGDPFDWLLPPVEPGTVRPMGNAPSPYLEGPAKQLRAGYYAVSATLVYGLPWRLYDGARDFTKVPLGPAWDAFRPGAFSYFSVFKPIHRVGHSIYVYKISEEEAEGIGPFE